MTSSNSKSYVSDPGRVRSIAASIAANEVSPVDLTHRCLERIALTEPHVQCWAQIDADKALRVAEQRTREAKSGRILGALHGIPIAVKDLIDVEGLPTRANSRSRANAPPAGADAEIVLALKAQGAIILGKVHTTEFAFQDPSPARNPHDIDHTPGGSSSGSAAAVASGMVPIAIGTQTGASVNRPAAYCGIAAFKPSGGSFSTYGITPLGPSYDTPGFYGWSVDDALYAYEAVAPAFMAPRVPAESERPVRICILEDDYISGARTDMRDAMGRLAGAFKQAGHSVVCREAPVSFERLFEIQRTTMIYEGSRALKHLLDEPAGVIGERLMAAIVEGLGIELSQYIDERRLVDEMRHLVFRPDNGIDMYLWAAAPSTAPKGLEWTGDTRYIAPWTALGGPIASVPAGLGEDGLPLGCILMSRPGSDKLMCAQLRHLVGALKF